MPTINGNRFPDKRVVYQQIVDNASADDIATKDIWITKIRFSNTTVGDITVTIHDKQGTPLQMWEAVNIPANSIAIEDMSLEPLFCSGGADIQASVAGLEAEIIGYTKP